MPKTKPFRVNPNPCDTCPYRKDTPSGIWHESEYRKLPDWDQQYNMSGPFLCHNGGKAKDTICRGWLEVHDQNLSVRLTCHQIDWTEETLKPTKIPLHKSGLAAMKAGIKRIPNPSRAARGKVGKLLKQKGKFKLL